MEPRILVVFHTAEGQAGKIAERIAEELRRMGSEVEVSEALEAPDPRRYDAVVVGDSIHATHHSRELTGYLKQHAARLNAMPTALFQVSMTSANPDDGHTADARALVAELMDRTGLEPKAVALFAGGLPYSKYGWFKRQIMRMIVKREGGDTDTTKDYEYTDWKAVDRFAADVDVLAKAATPGTIEEKIDRDLDRLWKRLRTDAAHSADHD